MTDSNLVIRIPTHIELLNIDTKIQFFLSYTWVNNI